MRPAEQRRARLPLHDAVQLHPTALSELRALAHDAKDLKTFDHMLPEIVALGEIELLVLVGLFIVDESIHQGFHVAHVYRFGGSSDADP